LIYLAPYIPLGNHAGKDDVQLEPSYYKLVIKAFIKSDKGKEEDFLSVVILALPAFSQIYHHQINKVFRIFTSFKKIKIKIILDSILAT
jgi:hypothetical protein